MTQGRDEDADHPRTSPEDDTVTVGRSSSAHRSADSDFLALELHPGQLFGTYRIVRLLGAGGMGCVYEAEEVDSGRRVALKLLARPLDSQRDRARFLREGRLAASVRNANSVFVFGTDEIDGVPCIAMELAPGGTLKDQIDRAGPMPVAKAVDAVLQVIAGLDASASQGLLHRDVKPSNCFVHADGSTKIGDYGLSISTVGGDDATVTQQGAVLGTFAFASPEQLRGAELDVRSDLYAVGATLYYLLSGRPPFASTGVSLLASVLEAKPTALRALRREVPAGLARIVKRCLQKSPQARFTTYAALAQALAPYSSTASRSAPLMTRLLAGLLDSLLGWAALMGVLQLPGLSGRFAEWQQNALVSIAACIGAILLEGLLGTTLGKWLCGLRIQGPDGARPGLARAALRNLIFCAPSLAVAAIWRPRSDIVEFCLDMGSLAYMGLMFVTVRWSRRRLAVHDVASGTRVVQVDRAKPMQRLEPSTAGMHSVFTSVQNHDPSAVAGLPTRLGPYDVRGLVWGTPQDGLLLAHDPSLVREVWIRMLVPGSAPLSPERRELGRTARLRWLAGRRTAQESWDAFEAPAGTPLLEMGAEPWSRVRTWIADLGDEIVAIDTSDVDRPTLGLDRVWITHTERAMLLDFPAPGTAPEPSEDGPIESRHFLHAVAWRALEGTSGAMRTGAPPLPLPLAAHTFLEELGRGAIESNTDMRARLDEFRSQPGEVSRARRAAHLGVFALIPILAGVMGFGADTLLARNPDHWLQDRSIRRIEDLAGQHCDTCSDGQCAKCKKALEEAAALTTLLHGHLPTASPKWPKAANTTAAQGKTGGHFARGPLIRAGFDARSQPTADEIQAAKVSLGEYLSRTERRRLRALEFPRYIVFGTAVVMALQAVLLMPLTLLVILLSRDGLLVRACGLAVVGRDGARPSRWRRFLRALMACIVALPLLGLALLLGYRNRWLDLAGWGGLLAYLGLMAWSLRDPARGPQDRVAGTVLVSR